MIICCCRSHSRSRAIAQIDHGILPYWDATQLSDEKMTGCSYGPTTDSQVDCEMTGLNPDTDRIIEIAVIITNGRLEPVDEGIEYVIQTPKEVLDG